MRTYQRHRSLPALNDPTAVVGENMLLSQLALLIMCGR
jgi:hypothetical protein